MTLRRQFHLLLAAIIVVPILAASALPLYNYFTSPMRVFMRGYGQLPQKSREKIDAGEWEEFQAYIRHLPSDMEVALLSLDAPPVVLLSSIGGLKSGEPISYMELWEFIAETSDRWFYQFDGEPGNDTLVILSRASKERTKTQRNRSNYVGYLTALLFVFAAGISIAIARISQNIFSSIAKLEKRAQKIANGELNEPLVDKEMKTRKGASNEIVSLSESLEKTRVSLLDAQEQRVRFIMGISHDLRTPVALIKGYTEALSDDMISSPDEVKKSLEIINAKTSQLEGMIDTLINFVKLESRDWRQTLAPESLRDVLTEFAKGAETTGGVFKRNVTYQIDISPETKAPMDRQLFERALENLLNNAIRYSKDGDSIKITGTETAENCVVSVSDTGIGMTEEERGHIFDLFYRASASRREEGMGIGLSVVKSIVDTHGWTIDVRSERGKGSSFIITIPIAKPDARR